jgi:hypothetical protein
MVSANKLYGRLAHVCEEARGRRTRRPTGSPADTARTRHQSQDRVGRSQDRAAQAFGRSRRWEATHPLGSSAGLEAKKELLPPQHQSAFPCSGPSRAFTEVRRPLPGARKTVCGALKPATWNSPIGSGAAGQ